MNAPSSRRTFLRGLVSLPLVGGSIALIGRPTAAAVPVSDALLDSYVAFLAHEHRAALRQRYPGWTDWSGEWHEPQPPMSWMPDDVCARSLCQHVKPSTRAALVLSAVGMPIVTSHARRGA